MPGKKGRNKNDIKFEDVSSYSSSKEYRKKKKNRRGRTVLKSIFGLFCGLLIVAGSGLIYLSTGLLSEVSGSAITLTKDELLISPDATTDDKITNIAFFGVDARDGTFKGLSDSIMVLTVDNKHDKIKMTSILRDSRVQMAGYDGYNKINAAYSEFAYPKDGGPELAIKTLNSNFMLNIEDYVTVNFSYMADIVNAFGGTVVTMDDSEAFQTNKNINALMYELIHRGYERTIWEDDFLPEDENGVVRGGTLTLNGNQAVAYARNRSDSDGSRSDRQKKVLMGLFSQLENYGTSDYYSLAQEILPLCETSLDFKDIWGLAPIITKNFEIETLTIPGDMERADGKDFGDGLGWVWRYDIDSAAEHIDRFIYEEGSPYWDAASGNGADNWDE